MVRPGPRVALPWVRAAGMAGTAGQGERVGAAPRCAVLLRVGAAPPPSRWLLTSIREICFNDLFVSRFPLGQRL